MYVDWEGRRSVRCFVWGLELELDQQETAGEIRDGLVGGGLCLAAGQA
jgi:hypothetical protein